MFKVLDNTHAACKDMNDDTFYPGLPENSPAAELQYNYARQICRECPIRSICLTYALEHKEPYGMWGGKTPRERNRFIKPERSLSRSLKSA